MTYHTCTMKPYIARRKCIFWEYAAICRSIIRSWHYYRKAHTVSDKGCVFKARHGADPVTLPAKKEVVTSKAIIEDVVFQWEWSSESSNEGAGLQCAMSPPPVHYGYMDSWTPWRVRMPRQTWAWLLYISYSRHVSINSLEGDHCLLFPPNSCSFGSFRMKAVLLPGVSNTRF